MLIGGKILVRGVERGSEAPVKQALDEMVRAAHNAAVKEVARNAARQDQASAEARDRDAAAREMQDRFREF